MLAGVAGQKIPTWELTRSNFWINLGPRQEIVTLNDFELRRRCQMGTSKHRDLGALKHVCTHNEILILQLPHVVLHPILFLEK